jgi:dethiobiotin synthetase
MRPPAKKIPARSSRRPPDKGSRTKAAEIIFVTGTDTGVGKTLLTAHLLHHLRESGRNALAMKPFCSGGRGDVALLQSLQPGQISDAEANPFYFPEPVAPWVSLRQRGKKISITDVVKRIRHVQTKCEILIIEGSGGLLVPLAENLLVADLIARLRPRVVVVARNRLGTINHTLLTLESLRSKGLQNISVALMAGEKGDLSSRTNVLVLRKWAGAAVVEVPYLGRNAARKTAVKNSSKKMKKRLARILD